MKRDPVFIVIFCALVLIGYRPTNAEPKDTTTWWLLADADSNYHSEANFDALIKLLVERAGVPSNQIQRIQGEGCSPKNIQNAIRNLAHRMRAVDRLIFFFQGGVTKKKRSNSIYLLAHGSELETLDSAIRDVELNRWFREAHIEETMVILDGHTADRNIYAYVANRTLLGKTALVSIKPDRNDGTSLLGIVLSMLQTDSSDINDDRRITVGELHEFMMAHMPPQGSIVAPMGNVDMTIMKLSPMLKIVTVPQGATIVLNGTDVGVTPKRIIQNLKEFNYEIGVKKPGYLTPSARSIEIDMIQGETASVSWVLKPIAIYGKISPPANTVLEQIQVGIEGTSQRQTVDLDGNYRFENLNAIDILSVGKTYTLKAVGAQVYHAETNILFEGYNSIQRDLTLVEKTWFEVAQLRFDSKDDEGAIAAFQNGIEVETDLPLMSTKLTELLFNSFSAAVDNRTIDNVAYLIATAQLADRSGHTEASKTYWHHVKSRTEKGTPSHKLATNQLRELNFGHMLINGALIVLLVVVLLSGGWSLHKYFKGRENNM